jgi:uncharacterized repeat protein (TIGR01451 family)
MRIDFRRPCLLVSWLVLVATSASSQTYEVGWWTVDGGGVTFGTGGAFDVGATAGQPDAGGPHSGAAFAVRGGFWSVTFHADLSISKTDGQTATVPGLGVTYTIEARNAGSVAALGTRVTDAPPASLLGVTWTCAASPGSSCPASGSGPIDHAVDLLGGGTATFTLTGTVDPAASGVLTNTASIAPVGAVVDPNSANNAASDTDTLTPEVDLAIALSDTPDPVGLGSVLTYPLAVTSSGPSLSPGAIVTHALPPAVAFLSTTPGPPTCTHAGGIVTCALGALAPGAGASITVRATVSPTAPATLTSTASIAGLAADPVGGNNTDSESTTVLLERPEAELAHASRITVDLAPAAGVPDLDLYRIRQAPYSSYEIVADAASGDVGNSGGPALERVAADGSTVLQSSVPVGTGPARSLRFVNATSSAVTDQLVRVRSLGCGVECGADDAYRLRAWDTTYSIARFDNSSSQLTLLLVQNPTDRPASVTVHFWSSDGTLLATHAPGPIPSHGLHLVNTATVPALAGARGSITMTHDAPYGALAGKALGLELTNGFSFDSAMVPRSR